MKMSRRAKRMARHHRRHGKTTPLNLVSLMDIFTILVFFLLVSSAPISPLPAHRGIELPPSTASANPTREALVILVHKDRLLLQGATVMPLDKQLISTEGALPALRQALLSLKADKENVHDGQLTIMGDAGTPYRLLQRILQSCQEAGFPHISLAIRHRAADRNPG